MYVCIIMYIHKIGVFEQSAASLFNSGQLYCFMNENKYVVLCNACICFVKTDARNIILFS